MIFLIYFLLGCGPTLSNSVGPIQSSSIINKFHKFISSKSDFLSFSYIIIIIIIIIINVRFSALAQV